MAADGVLIAPREDKAREWLAEVRERASTSVWATGGCQSWYLDHTGTPAYDAVTLPQLQASLAAPKMEDFEVRQVSATA